LIEQNGIVAARIARVAGHADRELVDRDPRAARNNRIEVILLREPQGK
jgi:chemotaxis protein MotB